MDFFERMGERSPFISSVIKFQSGYVYPFVFAALCAVSASFGKSIYIPCIIVLCLLTAFAGLFSKDLKVFIAPAFMIYYSIGSDKPKDFYENYYKSKYYETYSGARPVPSFEHASLIFFVVCLCMLAAILIYKLVHSGVFQKMLTEQGVFFYSVLALDAALVLNGAFGGVWRIESFLYGLLAAFVLTVCYCMFYVIMKSTKNGVTYTCVVLFATAFCVLLQVLIIAIQLQKHNILIDPQLVTYDRINRSLFCTAWGLVTIVAAVIACGIPAALYLARYKKFPVLCYFTAFVFFGATVFVNTRSSMLFGLLALIVGIIYSLSGKNKRKNIAMTLIILLLIAAILMMLFTDLPEHRDKLIKEIKVALRLNYKIDENFLPELLGPRYDLWAGGIKDFLRAPVFGVGFVSGDFELNRVYDHMYHNIVIEFMGAMGIVGILAFLFHIFQILRHAFCKFSANKLLLLCVPLSILGMSLLDNFFFYPNFNIIYGAALACAELCGEDAKEQLPST